MKHNNFPEIKLKKKIRVAIVQARFNEEITDKLALGAIEGLMESGVPKQNIEVVKVPGSFEIPLACARICKGRKAHGVIAIGAIIKGETAHFEYISQATIQGIMDVMLKYNMPISLGVITAYTQEQARKRAESENNKGLEAAKALLEVLNI